MAKRKQLDVIVDKKRWYRGLGDEHSRLLCDTAGIGNKMCCIGFLARTCGLTPKEIKGV